MNIGEFFVKLGVDAETVKLKDFVHSIGEIPVKAAAGIAALAGITLSIRHFAEEGMDAAVAFEAFEAQTGLSSQSLQKWRNIAVQANVSADSVTGSVTALQRQISEIQMGRGNISPFQILGIDPRQDAFKVIEQLRQKVRGMDRGTATNLISQMGLTPDMMQVLTLSNEKFAEFSKTVVGMSPQQVRAFSDLKLELTKLKMALHDIMFRVLGSLLPLILPIIHNVIPLLASFIENLVNGLVGLSGWLSHIQGAIPILAAAFGILALVFAPITAGVAALLLILEDLYVYAKGGKSVFGDAIAALKVIFEDPIASAKVLLELIDELLKKITDFIGLGDGVKGLNPKNLMDKFQGAGIMGKITGITAAQALAPAAVVGAPAMLGFKGMHNLMTGKGLFGGLFGRKGEEAEGMVAPTVQPTGAAGTTVMQENKVDINITSSAPAEDVAKAAKKEFDRHVNASALQTDNGGY